MAEHLVKQCVVCGEDLVGRPRVKDPKQRYYCPDCFDQALQQKRAREAQTSSDTADAPLSLDPSDDTCAETALDEVASSFAGEQASSDAPSLLDELAAQAPQPSEPQQQLAPCEHCGQPTLVHAVVCISCGFNRETGEILAIQTNKSKADWAADAGLFISPGVVGGGAMATFGILFFLGRSVEPAAMAFFLISSIFALAVTLGILFYAFRESLGQGVLTLFVPFYALWFVYGVHNGPYLKWLYGAMLVGCALVGALLASLDIDVLASEDLWLPTR